MSNVGIWNSDIIRLAKTDYIYEIRPYKMTSILNDALKNQQHYSLFVQNIVLSPWESERRIDNMCHIWWPAVFVTRPAAEENTHIREFSFCLFLSKPYEA